MDATTGEARRDPLEPDEASAAATMSEPVPGPSHYADDVPVKVEDLSMDMGNNGQDRRDASLLREDVLDNSRLGSTKDIGTSSNGRPRSETSTGRRVSPAQVKNGKFPFAAPSSNTAFGNSAKNAAAQRRALAAHRARIMALSKQLHTRLQYAAFKVEHGWSKQSLSEVENLYYRHRKGESGTHNPSPSSTSSARPLHRTSMPTTPTPMPRTSPTAVRKTNGAGEGQARRASFVEPVGGLVTPPASGNSMPSAERKASMSGGQVQHHPLAGNLKSPSLGPTRAHQSARRPSSASLGANSQPAPVVGAHGRSYADFWSKIGGKGGAVKR